MNYYFKCDFHTDNEAFEDMGRELETARILRVLAKKIESGEQCGSVLDLNGNKIGKWILNQ